MSFGITIVRMPARTAPSTFSLSPPIGSTRPESVTSPVIAMSCRAGIFERADTIAVAIAMPADGPSFGIAPAGTWMWRSRSKASSGMPRRTACERAYVQAARADSFMTSPSWPVRTTSPLPFMSMASMNMMSPPAGV